LLSLQLAHKANQTKGTHNMSVHCKWCHTLAHTSFYCRFKPRKPIPTYTRLRPVGKVGKKTAAAVAKWKRTQERNHEGYYECYMCGAWVTYLEAEHVKGKARHPELRTDPENLKPTCSDCNEKKRSKDLEEM
jgi:5-methylcytosine-specific restriction endonuclease McrA